MKIYILIFLLFPMLVSAGVDSVFIRLSGGDYTSQRSFWETSETINAGDTLYAIADDANFGIDVSTHYDIDDKTINGLVIVKAIGDAASIDGLWCDTCYTMSLSNTLDIERADIEWQCMQVTGANNNTHFEVSIPTTDVFASVSFKQCFFKKDGESFSGSLALGKRRNFNFINCIFLDTVAFGTNPAITAQANDDLSDFNIFNCTFVGNYTTMSVPALTDVRNIYFNNNLLFDLENYGGNSWGFVTIDSTILPDFGYNSSDTDGTNDNIDGHGVSLNKGVSYTFVDSANYDFHLTSSDAGALDLGTEIPYRDDILISTDDATWRHGVSFSTTVNQDVFGEDGGVFVDLLLRFQGIPVENGDDVDSLFIELFAVTNESDLFDSYITIEDTADATTFSDSTDANSRFFSIIDSVEWDDFPTTNGVYYRTPDLSSLFNPVVNRGDWVYGNSIAFSFQGGTDHLHERFARNWDFNVDGTQVSRLLIYLNGGLIIIDIDKDDRPQGVAVDIGFDELVVAVDGGVLNRRDRNSPHNANARNHPTHPDARNNP